mgnify:CR=1 FL=1
MLELYKNSKIIMEKVKMTKQIEIKKDLLDMQIEKVRLKTEMEVLD